MVKDNITCSPDSSSMPSNQLDDILREQGIILNTTGQKLLDLVSDGVMICQALCRSKGDPQDGPFLMVVKVSLPQKDNYGALLTELTGDNQFAELLDASGPVYFRVLRCRPAFRKVLTQPCLKLLS